MKTEIKTIKASSRASVKVGDSFYTVEYTEERTVTENGDEAELAEERRNLWDCVNSEVDSQIEDILRTFKK